MSKPSLPNPLRGVSLSIRLRHFFYDHVGQISPRYWWRAVKLFSVSFIRVYFSTKEKIRYSAKINSTIIKQDPIFIIGHWRSGTTYLHNLFAQDPLWGYPTLFHTSFPQCFFGYEKIKNSLENQLPKTRIMDNMAVSFDLPQEEEFAMANFSRFSFYHGLTYPKHFHTYFDKYILFNGLTAAELKQWQKSYTYFLKKITYFWGGKSLVLKNPVNTGRIKILLEMFPNAKFIHVHRDPVEVYYSTKKMLSTLIETMALHTIHKNSLTEYILTGYEKLMSSYLIAKSSIPAKQLFELSYADLIQQPTNKISEIYEHFQLNTSGLSDIKKYIKKSPEYQPNQFIFNIQEIELIQHQWYDIASALGYSIR